MDVKNFIKKTLNLCCIIFTLITVIYTFIVLFMNVTAEEILLDGTRIIMFLFFSFFVALATAIFSLKAIPAPLRLLIHYALCAFAFFVCVLLPVKNANDGFVLVGIVLFTLLYAIVAACVAFFSSRYKRLNEETAEYKKHFTK